MKKPILREGKIKLLTVKNFNGGINLRDEPSSVLDNQLTESENMLYLNGELKTRWAVSDTSELLRVENGNVKLKNHDLFFKNSSGDMAKVFSVREQNTLHFVLISDKGFENLPNVYIGDENYFLATQNDTLYLFANETVYILTYGEEHWVDGRDKIHIPTLAVDCKFSGGEFSGVFFEPINLIADSYKLLYTSKNENANPLTNDVLHEMTYLNYYYDEDLKKYSGKTITAEFCDAFGNKSKHSVVLSEDGFGKETTSSDGLYMWANINNVTFFTDEEYFNIAYKMKDDKFVPNDLTITFPVLETEQKQKKVYNCTISESFGGGKGIYGGSRLFLGGNESEENVVLWSDLNNPLYFPENNFFHVGNFGRVTALKKQSDMLVIFKENEIYYTKYQTDDSITADDVISSAAADYLARSVYFPLTQINSAIGCDCKNTVMLCDNRLLWANSNGRVYTLETLNRYSENNVYEIGQMISRKLKNEKDLKNAVCADFDGKYLLLCGGNLYILNYNCYGYRNISSYVKNEDANLKTEWYFCTIPKDFKNAILITANGAAFLAGNTPGAVAIGKFNDESGFDDVIYYEENVLKTKRIPIESCFKLKQFDFNSPFSLKDILSVSLLINKSEQGDFSLEYVCDKFTKTAVLNYSAKNEIDTLRLYPFIKQTKTFGLKFCAKGKISLYACSIKAKGE